MPALPLPQGLINRSRWSLKSPSLMGHYRPIDGMQTLERIVFPRKQSTKTDSRASSKPRAAGLSAKSAAAEDRLCRNARGAGAVQSKAFSISHGKQQAKLGPHRAHCIRFTLRCGTWLGVPWLPLRVAPVPIAP